ncbi:hypothetical protein Tco_1575136 [Tanacetum coccineum]
MGCDENRMSINLAAAVFVAVSILKALKTEDLSRKLEVNYVKFQFRGGLLVPTGRAETYNMILKRYKMDNSKRGHIPMQERLDLNKTQGASTPEEVKRMQNVPYASAVGSIMYVVRCTRPDVAFAQNITSRFQQSPGESHWTAVKNILKYLRNTKDMFLVYGGNPEAELRVDCYCDTGFETDIDDMKSQTGYVSGIILLILGGFAWCYTHAYIEDGVTFIAKSSVTFLAKRKFEDLLIDGQAILVDEADNLLKKVECPGDYDSEDEVALVDNDMARSLASERVGFSTQSLLEQ